LVKNYKEGKTEVVAFRIPWRRIPHHSARPRELVLDTRRSRG
jgi:hypothetical protein